MKPSIHPQYNTACQVTCACGNKFTTGSVQDSIELEICSSCHPAYTGVQKFVDTKGKIDKFQDRRAKATKKVAKA